MVLTTLKELFAGFVRTRGIGRHFRRFAIFDALRGAQTQSGPAPAMAQTLIDAAYCEPRTLLARLGTNEDGLTEEQAAAIRARIGNNEVEHEKPPRWWWHLWYCYKNPFNLLLSVLAVISYYTEDEKATLVIATMIALSVTIRFVQESRSNRAADELKAMVSNTATLLRADSSGEAVPLSERFYGQTLHAGNTRRVEAPISQLVPGDIVLLSAGDMIPADLRVLSAKDLFVSQSAMTGESLPVEKFSGQRDPAVKNPIELENIVFMGTNVVSGSATALVITTGNDTYFGALAERIVLADSRPTAFQNGVNQVSWLLIRFMLVMAPLVFLINGLTKADWLNAFLFALSIAVGLTPEMLPMIVTSTLAKGAVLLSRKKVIVKRLDAIQSFGAMNVLCTDKTGTLTQDKIFLARHTDVFGEESDLVLNYAYLNSYYQTGLKNLLDIAVLEHAELQRKLDVATAFRKVDEIPFDFSRRRMSVVVSEHEDHHLLLCKGAVEEILSVCDRVRHGDHDEPITPALLEGLRTVTNALNEEGLRVVAVAAKEMPRSRDTYGVADEKNLLLIGYIAFLDPPKESTAPALRALHRHGVTVKVLTGDNERVTEKICREVGLDIQGAMLGETIEKLDDAALARLVESHNVFAKLTPAHKERIVRALRANGSVVGFMGDGINDAPALRAADIGISVDSAVDIAKEAADIILLEKSLLVLEEGVLEGRRTFVNMLKYIKMAASSNFGNVFSVLIASAFLPFLPMLPLQLLVQNLLYDVSQISIPFDNVDAEQLKAPGHWRPAEIGRFMLYFGPISSVFDVITFAMMWYVFHANSDATQSLFQAGWFVEGLLSQTLIVHMIRTRKIPFIQSRASWPLLVTTAIIMAIGIFLPMGPLANYFKFQPLPAPFFGLLLVILLGYMALTQAMKRWYAQRYGWR